MKGRWEDYARKQGSSISKFVIEHVENSLRQEEEPSYKSKRDLWREVKELKKQIDELARDKRILELAMTVLNKS